MDYGIPSLFLFYFLFLTEISKGRICKKVNFRLELWKLNQNQFQRFHKEKMRVSAFMSDGERLTSLLQFTMLSMPIYLMYLLKIQKAKLLESMLRNLLWARESIDNASYVADWRKVSNHHKSVELEKAI